MYLCIPFGTEEDAKFFLSKKSSKFLKKKFAGLNLITTFAIPFNEQGRRSAEQAGFFSTFFERDL